MDNNITPSFSTFDIASVLAGRGYPETTVEFYLDEAAAMALSKAETKLTHLQIARDATGAAEFEKEVDALRAALRSQKYSIVLRGIPNKTRSDLLAKAFEKFPHKKNLLGQEEDSDERDQFYTTLLWQAIIVRIEAPDGNVQVNPDFDSVQALRDYAPDLALMAIGGGIRDLTDGVKAGFEAATQDTDFLSQP